MVSQILIYTLQWTLALLGILGHHHLILIYNNLKD